MKNILSINYDFPPAGGAGVKRFLKFLKFLPDYGWHFTVLTVKNGAHGIIDDSLINEINPMTEVIRTMTFETLFRGKKKSTNKSVSTKESNQYLKITINKYLLKMYKTIGKGLRAPDSRILWIIPALFVAHRISKRRSFDVIYTTGPTFVNHIIGAILKRKIKKKLILDFRDAWMADPMMIDGKSNLLVKINTILESFVIKNADLVISTTPFVTEDFRKRYPSEKSSKFKTIYNGYDEDDFKKLNERTYSKPIKLTFVYTGRLYAERTPKYFLKALGQLIIDNPELKKDIKAIFVGSCEQFLDSKYIEDYIKQYSLENIVELTGQVTREKSLEFQKKGSILLLLIGIVPKEKELTYGLSGKVFDYILSDKPILTLANGGSTREFINEYNIGSLYYHENISGIIEYIKLKYEEFKSGKINIGINKESFKKFDFKYLSSELSDLMNITIKNEEYHLG